jgi:hypothetical protein
MSQPPWPPRVGEVSNGHQWNGTQWVPLQQPPQVGQIVNGHRWDGTQWVPLAAPAPQVGQIANGHQWNGTQWVPLPQVGQVANGHRWDGRQWVPLQQQAPQVGQVANGHRWDGRQWVPLQQQAPQVGQVANGHRWDGRQWVPLAPAPARVHPVLTELHKFAEAWVFDWSQQGDTIVLSRVVAEQKEFMSAARLEYRARVRVDDAAWEVRFVDSFVEEGAAVPSPDEPAAGAAPETIEQQAARLGVKYTIDFRNDMVRDQVRGIAEGAHYSFRYGPW